MNYKRWGFDFSFTSKYERNRKGDDLSFASKHELKQNPVGKGKIQPTSSNGYQTQPKSAIYNHRCNVLETDFIPGCGQSLGFMTAMS